MYTADVLYQPKVAKSDFDTLNAEPGSTPTSNQDGAAAGIALQMARRKLALTAPTLSLEATPL